MRRLFVNSRNSPCKKRMNQVPCRFTRLDSFFFLVIRMAGLQANIVINRRAITSLAYFGDIFRLQSLYKEVRRSVRRLGLGPFDSPPDLTAPVLAVVDPYDNHPSTHDVIGWLDSLNVVSDSDSDSDSDDDSVDELEFLTRLYATVDARINPAYKARIVASGN